MGRPYRDLREIEAITLFLDPRTHGALPSRLLDCFPDRQPPEVEAKQIVALAPFLDKALFKLYRHTWNLECPALVGEVGRKLFGGRSLAALQRVGQQDAHIYNKIGKEHIFVGTLRGEAIKGLKDQAEREPIQRGASAFSGAGR